MGGGGVGENVQAAKTRGERARSRARKKLIACAIDKT